METDFILSENSTQGRAMQKTLMIITSKSMSEVVSQSLNARGGLNLSSGTYIEYNCFHMEKPVLSQLSTLLPQLVYTGFSASTGPGKCFST